jgi:tetratricopeptide (TPR) repeat protein
LNLGLIYKGLGQFDDSVVCYSPSFLIAEEQGNALQCALLLNNQGNVYSGAGDPQRAFEFLQDARETKERIGDPTLYMTLTDIGIALGRLGHDDGALTYYDQASVFAAAVGDELQVINEGISRLSLRDLARPLETMKGP